MPSLKIRRISWRFRCLFPSQSIIPRTFASWIVWPFVLWNLRITSASYQTFIQLFNLRTQFLTLNSLSWTWLYALPMITSALPYTTRSLTHTATFIINLHILGTAKKVCPAVNFYDFGVCVLTTLIFWRGARRWSLFSPGRKSPWNYALRRKQATKASGDASYLQTRHQSAARNELRLPISLGRHAHIARARYNFKSDFIAQASFLT